VWRELLGAAEIDPERTFFDLGASSLLMVRAQQALQQRLRRDVPVTALFEHPTVRRLAAHLDPASAPSPATGGPARERPRPDLRARRLAARGVSPRAVAEEGAQHP
jgi:acyl carrier protein